MNPRLAAFDFIARCLGVRRDPETDHALRVAIGSGKLDWLSVLDLAAQQKIAPALWAALRKRGLAGQLPAEARETLFKLHLLNTFRNKAFKEQAVEIVRRLNALCVEPVMLKGGVSLFVPTFDDPGARVMADLDLLVPRESARRCWDALCAEGYQPIEDRPEFAVDYSGHHHLRPLCRPRDQGTVELHREGLPESAARVLPTALLWREAVPVATSFGVRFKAPSTSHRILHNLLHSDWINGAYARGQIALRSLHEVAAIRAVHDADVDWPKIARMMDRDGHGKRLRASMYLLHRYLGQPPPEVLRGTVGAWLHYARTRSQVRWDILDRFAERADWFSARNICERYRCEDSIGSVGRGRLRLAAHLFWKRGKRGTVLGTL